MSFPSVKPNRTMLLRGLGTLVAIILLVCLLYQQGWEEIAAAVQKISPWQMGLAAILMVLSRLAVAARWHILLRSCGTQVSFIQSLRITLAGLFASNFLPSTIGGDVVRLAGALQLKMDTAVSAASLVADRLIGMAGMVMVVPFGLPFFLAINPAQSSAPGSSLRLLVGLAALPFGRWTQRAWQKGLSLVQRLVAALSLWLKQPRALLLAMIFTWVHMLSFFGVIALLFEGMGEPQSFWVVGGLYSIVYFLTLMPVSINGYGLQELSMTFAFSQLGGASASVGLTAALLFRVLVMAASLPGALFLPGLMSSTNRCKPAEEARQ